MTVGKMGWLPEHQSVMGAISHYSLDGGIQLGIPQGCVSWFNLDHTAAKSLSCLDSF